MKKLIFLLFIVTYIGMAQQIDNTREWGYTKVFSIDTAVVTTHFRTITIKDDLGTALTAAQSALITVFPHASDTLKVGFDGDTTLYNSGKLWVYPNIARQFARRAFKIHIKGTGASTVHVDVEYSR